MLNNWYSRLIQTNCEHEQKYVCVSDVYLDLPWEHFLIWYVKYDKSCLWFRYYNNKLTFIKNHWEHSVRRYKFRSTSITNHPLAILEVSQLLFNYFSLDVFPSWRTNEPEHQPFRIVRTPPHFSSVLEKLHYWLFQILEFNVATFEVIL